MKYIPTQMVQFLQNRPGKRNAMLLLRFILALVILVSVYSVIFRFIMAWEGREYSWLTGIYWTLTVMSTLGLGDITFSSDLGRVFTICVLLSGIVFLLVMLPFAFIRFFYAPWMEAKAAPRALPRTTSGHVVLTSYDPVTIALISKLIQYHYPYVLLVQDLSEALDLYDLGIKVIVGDLDRPETYRRIRIGKAALVAATAGDVVNTKVAFTVRGVSDKVPIIATADSDASVDILELAGCSHVFQPGEMMGQFLARRTYGSDALTHVIGQFDQLLIAETTAAGTPLVGKTLRESRLRELVGINVVGVWERGQFEIAGPETHISPSTVLVLAGSRSQLDKYNELFYVHYVYHLSEAPVVIIGGGRVGQAAGRTLAAREIDYCIVEQSPELNQDTAKFVVGNAADFEVLKEAGFMSAPTVIVTTHDDETNIYLTIYCRRLRPDIQIISRATLERSIPTLHRAGADFVMSTASMGANRIFNLLKRSDILMVTEGLDVFRLKVPHSLVGKTIAEISTRQETGCSVIAIHYNNTTQINPDPTQPLPAEAEIILIGSVEAENHFLKLYGNP